MAFLPGFVHGGVFFGREPVLEVGLGEGEATRGRGEVEEGVTSAPSTDRRERRGGSRYGGLADCGEPGGRVGFDGVHQSAGHRGGRVVAGFPFLDEDPRDAQQPGKDRLADVQRIAERADVVRAVVGRIGDLDRAGGEKLLRRLATSGRGCPEEVCRRSGVVQQSHEMVTDPIQLNSWMSKRLRYSITSIRATRCNHQRAVACCKRVRAEVGRRGGEARIKNGKNGALWGGGNPC